MIPVGKEVAAVSYLSRVSILLLMDDTRRATKKKTEAASEQVVSILLLMDDTRRECLRGLALKKNMSQSFF